MVNLGKVQAPKPVNLPSQRSAFMYNADLSMSHVCCSFPDTLVLQEGESWTGPVNIIGPQVSHPGLHQSA